jgi:Fe-Mn family superoxide dismutase
MAFTLPELPYSKDALAPHISAETLEIHHGRHHAKYVATLNTLTEGTENADKSLEELIKSTSGKLFNQAAQVWNHTFYWNGMAANAGGAPTGAIADAINAAFGSFDSFKEKFTAEAAGHFGSGWAWLVKDADGKLSIVSTHDAGNPMTDGLTPILTCDVWEHAYYVDYRNARPKYLEGWWNLVNWAAANKNL